MRLALLSVHFKPRIIPQGVQPMKKTPGNGDTQVASLGKGKQAKEVLGMFEGALLPICFIHFAINANKCVRTINVIPSDFRSPYSKMLMNYICGHVASSL